MEEKINSIDMNEKLDYEDIYNLFMTHSSKANKKIFDKIDSFHYNIDFFEYFSSKDIKNLLNVFEFNISENDEPFSSFNSSIEQYISCISQIILSIKLFLKIQDIITKIVINSKIHLLKLQLENKLENYNQDYLFSYLESLFKISEKISTFYPNDSTLSSSNMSTFKYTKKNSLFRKSSIEHRTDSFSDVKIESIIYDSPPTSSYESDQDIKNQEEESYDLENSIENNSPIKHSSNYSLTKYAFAIEPITQRNNEQRLVKSPIVESKIKNLFIKGKSKHKKKQIPFSETDLINKNKNKNYCKKLLEMINKMYKNEFINAEEKLKLKQLVIEKSEKIKSFYYNIYKKSKNENTIITEVRKIIN